jgi:N-acetyltransferase 10
LLQILDLVPALSRLYFLEKLPATLSYGQAAILLSLGLQHQDLTDVEVSVKCRLMPETLTQLPGLM